MAWPEWAVRAWEPVAPYAEKFAVWRGYESELQTLLVFAVGIAIYAGLVFYFYQKISSVEAWHSKPKAGVWGKLVHFVEAVFMFPLLSILYFTVLAASLFLLTKVGADGDLRTAQILLISMSMVVGVRVVAFASEGAANDIAKVLPLGLLGVVIVDPGAATWGTAWLRLKETPDLFPLLGRYFLLLFTIETVLGLGRSLVIRARERAMMERPPRPIRAGAPLGAKRTVPVKGATPHEGPAAPPAAHKETTTFTEME